MAYLILILTFFMFIILVKNCRNRFSWLLAIMIIGLDLALFASILQIARISNYYQPRNLLFSLDYQIYLSILNLRFAFSMVNRLLNIGIGLFLFVFPLFIYEFTSFRPFTFDRGKIKLLALSALYFLFHVWFYDPKTSTGFYLYIMGKGPEGLIPRAVFKSLIQWLDLANFCFVFLYLIYPFRVLIQYHFNTKINLKKQQAVTLGLCLLLLEIFFTVIFMLGPFRKNYFQTVPINWIFPANRIIPYFYFDILPLVMLVAIPVMFLLLIKYKTLDTNDFFRNLYIKRKMVLFNQHLRGIFHSYKNTMFMMKILAEQAEAQYGTEEGLMALKKISHSADITLGALTKMLDSMKAVKPKPTYNNLITAIETTLQRLNIPDSIKVNRHYSIQAEEANTFFDCYQLMDVFNNIIQNSIDALNGSKKEGGTIDIEVDAESDWIMVNVIDNGPGIPRSEIKNIFKPFYSTKSKQYNWGIGLSYVYMVMKRNSGFVTVESEVGKFTKFQLLFPTEGRR